MLRRLNAKKLVTHVKIQILQIQISPIRLEDKLNVSEKKYIKQVPVNEYAKQTDLVFVVDYAHYFVLMGFKS